jgi:glycosyltransferase involved in cell wall biosynthesis
MRPELSIVLPVYNQADHIVEVVGLWRALLKGRAWEIILVPNGCWDDSAKLCRSLAKKDGKIRVVESGPGGWGLGVRLGLAAARGKFLCYTNSARTDPAVLPPLFERLKQRPEALVKADRRSRGDLVREMGSLVYNLGNRLLFGVRSADVNGTPKLFQRDLLKRLDLVSPGDLLDAEVLARCVRLGVEVLEVPIQGWARHGGKSTTKVRSGARMILGLLHLKRRMR